MKNSWIWIGGLCLALTGCGKGCDKGAPSDAMSGYSDPNASTQRSNAAVGAGETERTAQTPETHTTHTSPGGTAATGQAGGQPGSIGGKAATNTDRSISVTTSTLAPEGSR
jgi:hypothetical protein